MEVDLKNWIVAVAKAEEVIEYNQVELNLILLRIAFVIKDRAFVFSIKNNRGGIDAYSINETVLASYPTVLRYNILNPSKQIAGEYQSKLYYKTITLANIKAELVPIDECEQIFASSAKYGCYVEPVQHTITSLGCILKQTLLHLLKGYDEDLLREFNILKQESIHLNLIGYEPTQRIAQEANGPMMTVTHNRNTTKYTFEDIKIKATKKWKNADGKARQKTKTFSCTHNSFNAHKTKEELIAMLEQERDAWLQEDEPM